MCIRDSYETLEEYWAYWSRYIYLNRYREVPKPVYTDLLQLVKDKDYFVLTTNVDHCFQRAGFDKKRLFYTQGDFGLWQCSVPCQDVYKRQVYSYYPDYLSHYDSWKEEIPYAKDYLQEDGSYNTYGIYLEMLNRHHTCLLYTSRCV